MTVKRKLSLRTVQDWMRNTGRGYAAASAHFGVSEIELRALKASGLGSGPGRGGGEPYRGDQPSPDPLDCDSGTDIELTLGDVLEVPEMPPLDASGATREDFLVHRLEHALKMVVAAVKAGSPNVARNWEVIAQRTRADLDEYRAEQERIANEAGKSALSDPVGLAKKISSLARELVTAAPAETRVLLQALARQHRLRLVEEDEDDGSRDQHPPGEEVQASDSRSG